MTFSKRGRRSIAMGSRSTGENPHLVRSFFPNADDPTPSILAGNSLCTRKKLGKTLQMLANAIAPATGRAARNSGSVMMLPIYQSDDR